MFTQKDFGSSRCTSLMKNNKETDETMVKQGKKQRIFYKAIEIKKKPHHLHADEQFLFNLLHVVRKNSIVGNIG